MLEGNYWESITGRNPIKIEREFHELTLAIRASVVDKLPDVISYESMYFPPEGSLRLKLWTKRKAEEYAEYERTHADSD